MTSIHQLLYSLSILVCIELMSIGDTTGEPDAEGHQYIYPVYIGFLN